MLTVVAEVPPPKLLKKSDRGSQVHVRCTCACGTTDVVRNLRQVVQGVVTSCGCSNVHQERPEDHQERVLRSLYRDKVHAVKTKKRSTAWKSRTSWDLTYDQFRELVTSPCWYTGLPPEPKFLSSLGETPPVNSIDRLDSDVGYVPGNCVPCNIQVNLMKGEMSPEEFVRMCKLVVENSERILSTTSKSP